MGSIRRLLLIPFGFLAVLLAFQISVTFAQRETDGRYFPETRHYVSGEFLEFYESVPNPEFVFGYPISVPFLHPVLNREVQYFQRARFEMVEDPTAGSQVILSPLGELVFGQSQGHPLALPITPSACQEFPETGHQVCYAFLDFFRAHGGVERFGPPISGFWREDERIVQYFKQARFTWNPEMPLGREVQLSDLGRISFHSSENPTYAQLPASIGAPQIILNLKVRAFTDTALARSGDQITLYAIVQDQNMEPVEGAQVTITVTPPKGEGRSLIMEATDEQGITQIPFSVVSGEVGVVEIQVEARYSDIQQTTLTSYRLWW